MGEYFADDLGVFDRLEQAHADATARADVSKVTQFSPVVVIENSLPVPCMAGYAVASVPLRSPALIFSLSR
jgi:hypothetical protein